MPLYPGSFREASETTAYHGARRILSLERDGENAHTLALRTGQLFENIPVVLQNILLGNKAFDAHLQKHNHSHWKIGNVQLPSPFVTAAGLLKRHDMVPYGTLGRLPIGAVTIGGITPSARKGNDMPRVHVDERSETIVNFMGLNNSGVDRWAAQIQYEEETLGIHHPPLIANIANDPLTNSEDKPAEAKEIARKIGQFIHVLEYNGSCPNVGNSSGAEAFTGESLESLKTTLTSIHAGLKDVGKEGMPVLLKLPPHLDQKAMERVINTTQHLVTGYTCINTSPNQTLKDKTPIGQNKGGLSGKLILPEMLRTVRLVRDIAPDTTIIALGGLGTGKTQRERFETGRRAAIAGASLVSAYSSLVLHGPGAMRDVIAGFIYEQGKNT